MRNPAKRLTLVFGLVAAMSACGGGGGASSSGNGGGLPAAETLTLAPQGVTSVTEGGAPITLTLSGASAAGNAVTWVLSPALGTLSSTSSAGAVYTPPAAGSLSANATVTVTATPAVGTGASAQFTVQLIAFGVVATTPAAAASGVALNVKPIVSFSRPVAAASLTSSSVTIASPIAAVPASISASGAQASLTPSQSLAWGSHYQVTLTTQVASTVGQTLPANVSFAFDTQAATWTPAAAVASAATPYTAGAPLLAGDGQGHFVGVWQQDTTGTGNWNINAATFDLQTKAWSSTVPLMVSGLPVYDTSAGSDSSANAIAVWVQEVNGSSGAAHMYAARYDHASAKWGSPVMVDATTPGNPGMSQIAFDAQGNAILVWIQGDGFFYPTSIYARRYSPATASWGGATLLGTTTFVNGGSLHLALDVNGNATVVWAQGVNMASFQVVASRWSVATQAWSTTPTLLQGGTGNGTNPQLAAAASGDVHVIWTQQFANGTLSVQSCRYDASQVAWGSPRSISGSGAASGFAQIGVDPVGHAMVIWSQFDAANVFSLRSTMYTPLSDSWTTPALIESVNVGTAYNPYDVVPSLLFDSAGNATAAWVRVSKDNGSSMYAVLYARYSSQGQTWSAPANLPGVSQGSSPQLYAAGDLQGNVLMSWGQLLASGAYGGYWSLLTGN